LHSHAADAGAFAAHAPVSCTAPRQFPRVDNPEPALTIL